MLATKERNAEPIPGYRLIEPLGRGGFGEVWKCEVPGGLFKAIKFVAGDAGGMDTEKAAAMELKAIEHVKSIRHPFLLSMDRVEVIDGELVIVMELADKSLLDLLNARRGDGEQGLDRNELLGYLGEAANVLDHMNFQHGLQHLDVKPANLFLVAHHVKVADFGLVHSLANHPGGSLSLAALTPLYAAPELYHNKISQTCDQYSLAVVYQELLTGKVPFFGKNTRQLMMLHAMGKPNLEALPEVDRPIIARALSRDPEQRFSGCTELINALLEGVCQPVGSSKGIVSATRVTVEARSEQVTVSVSPTRPAQAKYVREYNFTACLARTPWSEEWEGVSNDHRRWLLRFLFGLTGHDPQRDKEALDRLHRLEHDQLPSIHLVPAGTGCLIAVTERMDTTLRDRWLAARQAGEEGLPREQLLDWMWKVAEALDELNRVEGLCHLGLTPRHLAFKNNRIQIFDMGMLPLLWQPAGLLRGQLQPRYAAPELCEAGILAGQPTGRPEGPPRDPASAPRGGPASDQYSLAVIYQEMLTGQPPFRGRRVGEPNLESLPPSDRAVIGRALEVDPARRYPTCRDMVEGLDAAGVARPQASRVIPRLPDVAAMGETLAELLAEAGCRSAVKESGTWLTLPQGGTQVLRARFSAGMSLDNPAAAFEGFRKHWNAQLLQTGKDSLVYQVGSPARPWKRLFGQPPALLVEIQWVPAKPPAVPQPELTVHVRPLDASAKEHLALLRQVGPVLMETLQGQLYGHHEKRAQERRLWTQPVQAAFQLADGQYSETINCVGKDVSLTGMGLYVPCQPPGNEARLTVTSRARRQPMYLGGRCVRVKRCGDGWFEVGVKIL